MEANVPRRRGRPKKYHTEEEKKEASRISAKKSFQKRRELKLAPAVSSRVQATSDLQRPSLNVTSKHFQSDRSAIAYIQDKRANDPERFLNRPLLPSGQTGKISSPLNVPASFAGPWTAYSQHGLPHAQSGPSPLLFSDASGYPSWNPFENNFTPPRRVPRVAVTYNQDARRNLPLGDSHLPQLLGFLRANGRSFNGVEATATATNAQGSREKNVVDSEHLNGVSKARVNGECHQSDLKTNAVDHEQTTSDDIKAKERAEEEASVRRREEHAQRELLQRTAQNEKRALQRAQDQEQTLAGQPQDDFVRHIRFISEWLQADSYGKQHTFPTDGQAIYTRKIKPRIRQIRHSALSQNARFAIEYVGLMALTHILRLIYVHRGNRIGSEISRYYEHDAKLSKVDEITSAMLAVLEKINHDEKEWLKTKQGAAAVLMQEMLEVWPMVCSVGPPQVQQNLSGILWTCFRHRAVPSFS